MITVIARGSEFFLEFFLEFCTLRPFFSAALFSEAILIGRGGLAWQLQPWALGSHPDSAAS